jgi:hypothetical protein
LASVHLDIGQETERSTYRRGRQTEFAATSVQNHVDLEFLRTPRAFVAQDIVQERTNFVQERNIGGTAFIWRTCAASVRALRSTPVRTSRQTTWETLNDLENSKGCRSAGGHGNQHVRLRSAQVDSIKATARLGLPFAVWSRAGVRFALGDGTGAAGLVSKAC